MDLSCFLVCSMAITLGVLLPELEGILSMVSRYLRDPHLISPGDLFDIIVSTGFCSAARSIDYLSRLNDVCRLMLTRVQSLQKVCLSMSLLTPCTESQLRAVFIGALAMSLSELVPTAAAPIWKLLELVPEIHHAVIEAQSALVSAAATGPDSSVSAVASLGLSSLLTSSLPALPPMPVGPMPVAQAPVGPATVAPAPVSPAPISPAPIQEPVRNEEPSLRVDPLFSEYLACKLDANASYQPKRFVKVKIRFASMDQCVEFLSEDEFHWNFNKSLYSHPASRHHSYYDVGCKCVAPFVETLHRPEHRKTAFLYSCPWRAKIVPT